MLLSLKRSKLPVVTSLLVGYPKTGFEIQQQGRPQRQISLEVENFSIMVSHLHTSVFITVWQENIPNFISFRCHKIWAPSD